jgi:hypothetical protein
MSCLVQNKIGLITFYITGRALSSVVGVCSIRVRASRVLFLNTNGVTCLAVLKIFILQLPDQ